MDSGNAALTPIHLADFASRRTEALPSLALGSPSLVPNLDFDTRIDTPHAGIILLGPVDPAELAENWTRRPIPQFPSPILAGIIILEVTLWATGSILL